MQRYTTVLKQSSTMADQPAKQCLPLSTRANVYAKNSMNSAKSSNESSSSALTTNSDSSDNNETVTLTSSNALVSNSSPRYRPTGRRFFSGKSKSAAVSRSASNTSRILNAEKIYIQNSSDDQLSTSETDDLNSDDDDKLVYKTCLESPPAASKSMYLKKSMSRPECAIKSYQYGSSAEKSDTSSSRRFAKENRLRTSKSMSHCKNAGFQNDDDDEEEANEEEPAEDEPSSLYYRQLDGRMKQGRLSRFKVIKSKSNSALQSVRSNLNRKCDYHQDDKSLSKQPIKGNQRNDQITSQVQLNELAERLKFIEQKLLENELNAEKKLQTMSQTMPSYHSNNYPAHGQSSYLAQPYSGYLQQSGSSRPNHQYPYISQPVNGLQNGQKCSYPIISAQNNCQTVGPNFLSQNNSKNSASNNSRNSNCVKNGVKSSNSSNLASQNQDDFCLKNGQFRARIYPSISFGDCSEIHVLQPKKSLKRHFFSSAIKNSKSLAFLPNSKEKSEKSCVDKTSNLPGSGIRTSASKIWKTPFNILGNLIDTVDDKVLKGRWHSSKSVKSSSSSNSIRSNSICSASNLTNVANGRRADQPNGKLPNESKPLYGPIFNKRKEVHTSNKSLSSKFISNFSLIGQSRKAGQNNQSNASSSGDLARSTGSNNSSRFSSTKQLDIQQSDSGRNQLAPSSGLKPQKARAYSTPNEEIFSLLSLPFREEEDGRRPTNEFDPNGKQPKCYKEINSKALKEIEAFEKLLSDKFTINSK